jgi:hypothetical protein
VTTKAIIAGAAILAAATALAVAQTTGTGPAGSGTHSRTRGAVPAAASARPATPATRAQQPAPARPAPRDRHLSLAVPDAKGFHRVVFLRALDKITGRAVDLVAPAGRTVQFATLSIVARYCHARPPEEPPDSSAFLQIRELKPNEAPVTVFSGWMFAASPSINGLEHPVYDVWVIRCITDEPAPPPPAPPVVAKAHRPPAISGAPDSVPPGATVSPAPGDGAPVPDVAPQPELDEPVEEDVGVGELPSR